MKFVALLLFETRVGGTVSSYTEEIHLLDVQNLAEAQAQAKTRGQAQETDYTNEAGREVVYRLLDVIDVQPRLFDTDGEALYTRSFESLSAYRQVANLSGPIQHGLVNLNHLPALAEALQSLFDPRFRARLEIEGLGFDWNGRWFGSLEVGGMESSSVASAALSTAHDAVLEGMGKDGEHPGALANASCYIEKVPEGYRLILLNPDGSELASARWITAG